jgi:hypothetical protein
LSELQVPEWQELAVEPPAKQSAGEICQTAPRCIAHSLGVLQANKGQGRQGVGLFAHRSAHWPTGGGRQRAKGQQGNSGGGLHYRTHCEKASRPSQAASQAASQVDLGVRKKNAPGKREAAGGAGGRAGGRAGGMGGLKQQQPPLPPAINDKPSEGEGEGPPPGCWGWRLAGG